MGERFFINNYNDSMYEVSWTGHNSYFDSINIEDRVLKRKKSLEIKFLKNEVTFMEIDFNCDCDYERS